MTFLAACPACAAGDMAVEVAQKSAKPSAYFSLPTIHCAACIGKVERALAALPGVESARVNLSLKRVAVSGDATPANIVDTLAKIGFEAHPLDAGILETTVDTKGRQLLTRLAVAGFAMMNVMLLSVSVWSGATDATRDLFHMISAAIALPVVAYSAQPFFLSAWSALRVRALNMDVPISLAIILAAAMSLYETFNSGHHAYFDAALSLTFFLLIGRYLDHKTRSAARSAAKELSALEVRIAQRMVNGAAVETPVAALRIGDEILIATGARAPVDGKLLSESATTDRSFLTGESAAAHAETGEIVQAGEINLGAPFIISATAVGEDTTLRRVAALVEMAENSRNSYTALADRAARVYAPAVHLLALVAFIGWAGATGDLRNALNIAIAVLIITCPCALGLAVPAVATAAIGKLYGRGVLVKSGTALERMAEVDVVIFDKTGTLTEPGLDVSLSALTDEQKAVAVALAQSSDHPVSRAIAGALSAVAPAKLDGLNEVPGMGVEATLNGAIVRLGKAEWLGGEGGGVMLRIGEAAPCRLPTFERLRPGAQDAVTSLLASGYDVRVMSGDATGPVQAIADKLGITNVASGISGEEKHTMLTRLAAEGNKVLMVGDGLNDTAALAAAHASIAPSSALDASRNAADLILLRGDLGSLPTILETAKAASRLSQQNFGIATGYNLIAVPIALVGLATPLLAALAMSTSSVTVLVNALRVRRAA
ncbi:MAG: heavy metal translocating P-type ATPase [Pikeienuella sp.]